MYAFEYHRPHTLSGALADLGKADAKALAGGMTLLPTMKQRLAAPVRARRSRRTCRSFPASRASGDDRRHRRHDAPCRGRQQRDRQGRHPGARRARRRHRRSRMCATAARSAARSPTTIRPPTIPPPRSRSARRSSPTSARIAADDYFKGLFETALEPGELITEVSFPIPQKAAYMKFPNPASRYALVGVFVAKTAGGVRVAVTGRGRERRVPRRASSKPR